MNMKKIVPWKKKKRIKREEPEQVKFIAWLRKNGYRCHHSPNGGSRHILEAVRLKALGVSAGFPDVEVPFPSGKFHGFYCEMKPLNGGVLSEVQREWLDYLNGKGYFACIAQGFEEAKEFFNYYLSFTLNAA